MVNLGLFSPNVFSQWKEIVPQGEWILRSAGAVSNIDTAGFTCLQPHFAQFLKLQHPSKPLRFVGDAPLAAWAFLGWHTRRFARVDAGPTGALNSRIVEFSQEAAAAASVTPFQHSIQELSSESDNVVLFVTCVATRSLTLEQLTDIKEDMGGAASLIRVVPASPLPSFAATDEELAAWCTGVEREVGATFAGLSQPPTSCAVVIAGPIQLGMAVGRALATILCDKRPEHLITYELYSPDGTRDSQRYVRAMQWQVGQ